MDTNRGEVLLLKTEVFQIVGCAIEILNTLGHGLVEKPYENALVVEFSLRKIPFKQQPSFDVLYKGRKIGLFVPDLIVFDALKRVGFVDDIVAGSFAIRQSESFLAERKSDRHRVYPCAV